MELNGKLEGVYSSFSSNIIKLLNLEYSGRHDKKHALGKRSINVTEMLIRHEYR
jgi:hypothetical protein